MHGFSAFLQKDDHSCPSQTLSLHPWSHRTLVPRKFAKKEGAFPSKLLLPFHRNHGDFRNHRSRQRPSRRSDRSTTRRALLPLSLLDTGLADAGSLSYSIRWGLQWFTPRSILQVAVSNNSTMNRKPSSPPSPTSSNPPRAFKLDPLSLLLPHERPKQASSAPRSIGPFAKQIPVRGEPSEGPSVGMMKSQQQQQTHQPVIRPGAGKHSISMGERPDHRLHQNPGKRDECENFVWIWPDELYRIAI